MSAKTIISSIVIMLIVIAAGYLLLRSPQQSRPASSSNTAALPNQTSSPSSISSAPEVVYSDSGFSPQTLRIAPGTAVTFKNQSANPLWVASDPHPIHTNYPEFDAKRGYGPGEGYSFTFTKTGTWSYHNHRNASRVGTIIVE